LRRPRREALVLRRVDGLGFPDAEYKRRVSGWYLFAGWTWTIVSSWKQPFKTSTTSIKSLEKSIKEDYNENQILNTSIKNFKFLFIFLIFIVQVINNYWHRTSISKTSRVYFLIYQRDTRRTVLRIKKWSFLIFGIN
jgi:hypothetical protein